MNDLDHQINGFAEKIIRTYTAQGKRIVTAESCTGGLIAAGLTEISGSSKVVERGFVTYSNDAKIEVLAVLPDMLDAYGAVSEQVAAAMAQGALDFSHADIAISTTGIAGPTGATEGKPVGLVFVGIATRDGAVFHYKCQFSGSRQQIRTQTVLQAMQILAGFFDEAQA